MKRMTDPLSAPAWPPTNFSLPELWERITAMFAVLMREVRSTAQLAARITTCNERHAIRCRLEPLEKLVRSLLRIEAIIHLLMTPQGRDLLATAKPSMPPTRRLTATQSPPIAPSRTNESVERPRPFRVFAWETLANDEGEATTAPPPAHEPHHVHQHRVAPVSARHLARRIDALSRVITDREPTVLRLAKFIAGLPRDALDIPATLGVASLGWWHGRPEYFNVIGLEKRAVTALHHSVVVRDDPG